MSTIFLTKLYEDCQDFWAVTDGIAMLDICSDLKALVEQMNITNRILIMSESIAFYLMLPW